MTHDAKSKPRDDSGWFMRDVKRGLPYVGAYVGLWILAGVVFGDTGIVVGLFAPLVVGVFGVIAALVGQSIRFREEDRARRR